MISLVVADKINVSMQFYQLSVSFDVYDFVTVTTIKIIIVWLDETELS